MLNEEQVRAIKKLRDNPLYSKALNAINEKYRKTGRYGGKIRLEQLTFDEKISLHALDKNIMNQSFAEFTVQSFLKKKLLTGILQDVNPQEFWDIYNRKKIVTNPELKNAAEHKKNLAFQGLLTEFNGTDSARWLSCALETKKFGYRQILRTYKEEPSFERIMKNVMGALNNYPRDKFLTLPLFATESARDPHYFDYGTVPFGLLLQGFCFLSVEKYPANMEEIQGVLLNFNLVKDLVSNQILTYNISAIKNGSVHEGIEKFNLSGELLPLTLKNIESYELILAKGDVLYVFENPSVFSAVMDSLPGKNISMVCTSGNIKLSAIHFLDKALKGCKAIYYSGDMDPEGLKIADYLKQRYGEKLRLWRMTVEDYNASISRVALNDERLGKLKSVKTRELLEVAAVMEEKKLAGYQELILERYVEDILGLCSQAVINNV